MTQRKMPNGSERGSERQRSSHCPGADWLHRSRAPSIPGFVPQLEMDPWASWAGWGDPKTASTSIPLEGLTQDPSLPWTPLIKSTAKGNSFPTFIITPGSKFSSFAIFSPTVVALNVVAHPPPKFRTPPPRVGAHSPVSVGAGWRWGLSQSLWRRILFCPIKSAAHGGATGAAATPRDTGDIPGAQQAPQSSALHPSRDKDTPGQPLQPK